jgi:hypothetical protein
MPNSSEAIMLEAFMDRRQGDFRKAIQELADAIALDPRNAESIAELGNTLFWTRQFDASSPPFIFSINSLACCQSRRFKANLRRQESTPISPDIEVGTAASADPSSVSSPLFIAPKLAL